MPQSPAVVCTILLPPAGLLGLPIQTFPLQAMSSFSPLGSAWNPSPAPQKLHSPWRGWEALCGWACGQHWSLAPVTSHHPLVLTPLPGPSKLLSAAVCICVLLTLEEVLGLPSSVEALVRLGCRGRKGAGRWLPERHFSCASGSGFHREDAQWRQVWLSGGDSIGSGAFGCQLLSLFEPHSSTRPAFMYLKASLPFI